MSLRARLLAVMIFLGVVPIVGAIANNYLSGLQSDADRAADEAKRSALLLQSLNALVYAVVMDSRGIYMSAGSQEAAQFEQGILRSLDSLRKTAAEWSPVAASTVGKDTAKALLEQLERFNAVRTETARLSRQDSPAAARVFGDNAANRAGRKLLNDALVAAVAEAEKTRLLRETENSADSDDVGQRFRSKVDTGSDRSWTGFL